MCPLCVTTVALVTTGGASAGGLALLARTLIRGAVEKPGTRRESDMSQSTAVPSSNREHVGGEKIGASAVEDAA